MTWNRSDSRPQGTRDPLTRGRAPVAREAVPEQVSLDDPENLPDMFTAMGVGVNGQGIFGEEQTRYPAEMEQALLREHGWIPERQWDVIRRFVFRDTQAV